MANTLDTSWFDLRNYEYLNSLKIEGWIWQLKQRSFCAEFLRTKKENDEFTEQCLLAMASTLKTGFFSSEKNYFIDYCEQRANYIIKAEPFATSSVNCLSSNDIWRLFHNEDIKHVWDACRAMIISGV